MAQRFEWTQARNRQVLDMRRAGATWDTVAAAIGVGRNSVIDHARRRGVRKRSAVARRRRRRARRPTGRLDRPATPTPGG